MRKIITEFKGVQVLSDVSAEYLRVTDALFIYESEESLHDVGVRIVLEDISTTRKWVLVLKDYKHTVEVFDSTNIGLQPILVEEFNSDQWIKFYLALSFTTRKVVNGICAEHEKLEDDYSRFYA